MPTSPKPASSSTEATVKQVAPAVELGPPEPHANIPLTKNEQEAILGDAQERLPTSPWFVALDDDGKPTGSILEQPPSEGRYISVIPVTSPKPEVLMTPSGAPLTENMNPEHSFHDFNLEARNPSPGRVKVDRGGQLVKGADGKPTLIPTSKTPSAAKSAPEKAPVHA